MTRLITTIVTALLVLLALAAVSPRITEILGALPPVILLATVCVALLRCLWFYTR
jgi:uncharacterized membrane protein